MSRNNRQHQTRLSGRMVFSSTIARLSCARVKFRTPERSAPFKIVPSRIASLKSAPRKMTFVQSARVKLARVRFAPVRSVLRIKAWLKSIAAISPRKSLAKWFIVSTPVALLPWPVSRVRLLAALHRRSLWHFPLNRQSAAGQQGRTGQKSLGRLDARYR